MPDELLIVTDSQPSRADAVKNRALLLDTARQLFAAHGVEAVTMSAVAEAAGVGKGTLYRHFENKGALCYALLDDEQRQFQERTFRRLSAGGSPLEKLRWFLVEAASFTAANVELMYAEMSLHGMPMLAHPAHMWWRQTIRGLLGLAHLPGDVEYLTDVLYVMLDSRTIVFQQRGLGYSFERIRDGIVSLVDVLAA